MNFRSIYNGNKVFDGHYSQRKEGYKIPKGSFLNICQSFVVQPNQPYEVIGNLNVQMLNNSKIQMYIDFGDSNGSNVGTNITDNAEVNGQYKALFGSGVVPNLMFMQR